MTDADIGSDDSNVGDFGEVAKMGPLVWGARFLGGRLLIAQVVVGRSLGSQGTELKRHQSRLRQEAFPTFTSRTDQTERAQQQDKSD